MGAMDSFTGTGCGKVHTTAILTLSVYLILTFMYCSLSVLSKGQGYNYSELNELKRRKWMLLFYILRSPFYDRYSK